MSRIKVFLRKVFGSANDRKIRSVRGIIEQINALEAEYKGLSDAGLIEKTATFKARFDQGENLDALLPEAFANVREAAFRAIGLRAFDTQLIGGIFLHRGNIAEMKTGEGKTLVATFPAYLNALTGKSVHIVTVNDYLARRDAQWMGQIYKAVGMTTGVIYPQQDDEEKKAAYNADVTYATNNELGFDYLRDNMRVSLDDMAQRDHSFAIVDEVDSILIDEARTPLVISGAAQDRSALYTSINELIPQFSQEHIVIDEKRRSVTLTDDGNDFAEKKLREAGLLADDTTLYDPESVALVHHINQGLSAYNLFSRDTDYIVREGQVVLIDEFTGRMTPGRRLGDGLHQALEAKEKVAVQSENTTLASVTFQNYFRMYDKLAGMTGTAETEAEEFSEIYGLGVVVIPTHLPVMRIDENDEVYRTSIEKYKAVVQRICTAHETGQPVLVGTTSIEKSEILSKMLAKEKMEHNVLNARQHEQEAKIIANAGRAGAITIATNMAGRGTDIQLGGNPDHLLEIYLQKHPKADPEKARAKISAEVKDEKARVIAAGGLFVLATERHESRRIDNQLRGRSGRQGDPGRSSFFLSLEDDLLRIFGSERLERVLSTLGLEEGEAIIHPWVNKSLERAQAKIEGRNFDVRKQLLKFDNVMNDQRRVIFSQRREIMGGEDLSETIVEMRHQYIEDLVVEHIPPNTYPEQWRTEDLQKMLKAELLLDLPIEAWGREDGIEEAQIIERVCSVADGFITRQEEVFGKEAFRSIEKQVLLEVMDRRWREHLVTLEHLRSVIGFRGYAQRDPLNEYKNEAFQLFEVLLEGLRKDVSVFLNKVMPAPPKDHEETLLKAGRAKGGSGGRGAGGLGAKTGLGAGSKGGNKTIDPNDPSSWGKVARNQDCPCGSGKKYKHCHGLVSK